jgi:hypothetical protein
MICADADRVECANTLFQVIIVAEKNNKDQNRSSNNPAGSPVDDAAARHSRSGSGSDRQTGSTSEVTPNGHSKRQDADTSDSRNSQTRDGAGSADSDPGHS